MTEAAAQTGAGPMTMVAIEQHFPEGQRIVEDPLAAHIVPWSMRAYVRLMQFPWARDWMVRATEKSLPGLWAGMLCRKRYIDEKLIAAAANDMGAVVNLGAGFDTRAYRLPVLAGKPTWEVDQPQNIEAKRVRLWKLFGTVPAHVRLVAIDFDRAPLATVLAARGYGADRPTFFIWEAVTQYLSQSGINETFDFLAQAAPGSRLAFTYIRQAFLDGHELYGQEALYKEYVEKDRMWRFGMEPERVADYIGTYGWRVLEHVGYEELAKRFVKPTGRALDSSPVERMVYAEKL